MEEGDFSSPLPPLARVVPLNVRTMNEIHTKETASYAGRRDRLFNFFMGIYPRLCTAVAGIHQTDTYCCRDSSNKRTNAKDEDDDGDSKLCIIVTAIVGSVTGNYVNPEAVVQND